MAKESKLRFVRTVFPVSGAERWKCGHWKIVVDYENHKVRLSNFNVVDSSSAVHGKIGWDLCVFDTPAQAIEFAQKLEDDYYNLYCKYNEDLDCYEAIDDKYLTPSAYYTEKFKEFNT